MDHKDWGVVLEKSLDREQVSIDKAGVGVLDECLVVLNSKENQHEVVGYQLCCCSLLSPASSLRGTGKGSRSEVY